MIWTNFEVAIVIRTHTGYGGNPSYRHRSHMWCEVKHEDR